MKKNKIIPIGLLLLSGMVQAQQSKTIFNGKNLDGWYVFLRGQQVGQDSAKVFTVQDGLLHISGQSFGYIATTNSYRNFHLTLEFKWGVQKHAPRLDRKRDSGVLYYFSPTSPDKVWPRSIECQIQEGDCGDFWLVDSTSLTVNGTWYPPTRNQQVVKSSDHEKPYGEWNTLEIIGRDGKCTHIMNGVVVNEGTDANVREGKIALQSEGAEIYYRNIRVKEF